MLKNNYLKILSFSLILILMLSCPGVSAFASAQDTPDAYKAVTVDVKVPFSCYAGQETMVVNLIISSRPTYSYDDGQYKGTLKINSYNWTTNSEPGHQVPGPCYLTLDIQYFGIATRYQ
ncbi:hypothetical protein SAMN02745136_03501 [Anaerocolumna jejuensis DSM 15929]|uniref:Uncharacterized protein n=1 Tax=Anaerocolumna jejuensis DSM 15929 TaxID=1121322 RepID=A0A1M6VTF9_9FIRM|nr:hypothetical protein [Anaerocolumna jejuensis]SHK84701.1 hypothetical protein SAMN02745136_03501 [Anaerocolumna jejuensis DSM 15929]